MYSPLAFSFKDQLPLLIMGVPVTIRSLDETLSKPLLLSKVQWDHSPKLEVLSEELSKLIWWWNIISFLTILE